MILAIVEFGEDSRGGRDELKNVAVDYLVTFCKQGRICGDYLLAWQSGTLTAYANLARPDAFQGYQDTRVLSNLNTAFGRPPDWRLLGDVSPVEFPSWKECSSLYLFAHMFDDGVGPVKCGDSGLSIPAYKLPLSESSREGLCFWANSYRDHDRIAITCGELEIPAYKQLADPFSGLSVTGRKLSADIESATQKPTYYYLHRYWGRNEGEAIRPCPVCGETWHVRETKVDERPFYDFHFRCEPCRLVSQVADSYEDERHARIGEFKPRN